MIGALSSRYTSVSITCVVSSGDAFNSQRPHIPCWSKENAAATSKAELVQVAVDLADLLARPLMSPAEFRASLGPWRTSAPAPAPAPLAEVESR